MIKNKNDFKIDFFCIGAQKAGTTSLHDSLVNHSEIYLPKLKECHYFETINYKTNLSGFREHFDNKKKKRIIGNINPNISLFPEISLKRIKYHFPDAKIIFILRNCYDRAYSHYKMSVFRGREEASFKKAIYEDYERFHNKKADLTYNNHFALNNKGYYSNSIYSNTITEIKKNFSKDKVYITNFEELTKNPDIELKNIQNFLGVAEENITLPKSNASKRSRIKFLNRFIFSKKKGLIFNLIKQLIGQNITSLIKIRLLSINLSKNVSKKISTFDERSIKILFQKEQEYVDTFKHNNRVVNEG